jgi:UDPglucose--hexose-1-phosphate uridylyltransferase
MGVIRFESFSENVRFHSPLKQMELVEVEIQRRRDPLSGRCAIYSSALKDKGRMFFGPTDRDLIARAAEQSRANCFFCPENVEGTTPRYEESWVPGGFIRTGDCFLFPNLFPLSALHAVIALGKKHVRDLDDFPAPLLRDGFSAALQFARSVHRSDSSMRYLTVNANYLFPAGASLVHPHLQLFGGKYPSSYVEQSAADCRRFREEQGQDYFELLVEEEKRSGQRYVASSGPVHWLVPFAPIGTNEILGILPGQPDLLAIEEDSLEGLSAGLSKILAYYHQIGFSTFNFTVYSAALGRDDNPFPVFIRVICRQNVSENYRTDDYFIQKLLGEELMLILPEDLAAGVRNFWNSGG